jgi:UDP-N-acetylmuramate dehydrogenase
VWGEIEAASGKRLVRGEPMSRHTTFRIGGPADLFIEATSADDLRDIVLVARRDQVPHFILGGGSNLLVSDAGMRGLVILNRARNLKFQVSNTCTVRRRKCLKSQTGMEPLGGDPAKASTPRVHVESGVILPTLARECIERGLAGLEWAIGVPGTVGGAVVGNAGAHGSDVAQSLISASILAADGNVRDWSAQALQFGYRSSVLKSQIANRQPPKEGDSQIARPVVLAAEFELKPSTREECEARAAEFAEKRKRTQPTGATIGSMFKNPPGDYAGRLIEAAGLKGARAGNAEISSLHANFFVNLGGASAADINSLINLAREKVQAMFGVELELEIQLVGEW